MEDSSVTGSALEACSQVVVKWRGNEYRVEALTLGELKSRVGTLTGVSAKRQKLMGLPPKAPKNAPDDATLASLFFKPDQRLMMMGSPETEHEEHATAAEEAKAVQASLIDDLDDADEALLEAVEHNAMYLAKIESRIKVCRAAPRRSPLKSSFAHNLLPMFAFPPSPADVQAQDACGPARGEEMPRAGCGLHSLRPPIARGARARAAPSVPARIPDCRCG